MSEFADYLNDHLQSLMIEFGIEKALALEVSSKFISDLRRDFGGEILYLSSKGQQSHVARRLAIIRDFRSGQKVSTLVLRYGLSRATIYRLIKG